MALTLSAMTIIRCLRTGGQTLNYWRHIKGHDRNVIIFVISMCKNIVTPADPIRECDTNIQKG
jgi:hypothetical protein